MIVNGQSGLMQVFSPSSKELYTQAGPDDDMSRAYNPFGAYAYYVKRQDVRNEGPEMVGGIPCTKQVISSQDQVTVIGWVSTEFAFPLKVEIPVYSRTMELRKHPARTSGSGPVCCASRTDAAKSRRSRAARLGR